MGRPPAARYSGGTILTFAQPGNVYSVLFAGSMFGGLEGSASDMSSFLVRMAPVATTPIPAALPLPCSRSAVSV